MSVSWQKWSVRSIFGNESNLLLQAKYFGPGKIAYFSSGFHFYVQVKNLFIQEIASSIQKFWSLRSLCSINLEHVSCDQISHDICINLGLSFCGQNFQVIWKLSSEAIEYRMQSLVNWKTDEYILCFSLLWSRAVCWNWFKPENAVEPPRLRAGSRSTFADRESATVIG